MAFQSLTSLQKLELVKQELDHEQARTQNHSTRSSTSTASSTSEKEVKNAGRKRERRIARDDRFEPLMKKARKCAEERHAALEKVKMETPGRKPSRAITSRQKSSKKSAEICRIKTQIYTEFLEAELAQVQDNMVQQRLEKAKMAQQLRSLNARLSLQLQRKQDQHQQLAAKNKTTSISSPSFVSEVTAENDHCVADHIGARGEQLFSQKGDTSFAHMTPNVEEDNTVTPLSDDDSSFSPSRSASDFLELPLSPLSFEVTSQPDDMTSDTQAQEMDTYRLHEDDALDSGSFIDFDEMDACLEFQPSFPTTTLFNTSSLNFSFLS